MAKIQTEIIVIKLNKLIKDSSEESALLTNEEFDASLETIIQELVSSDNILVEIERGN